MASPYEIALKLCEAGFSVIPAGGGKKHNAPIVNWQENQEHKAEKRELENWEYRYKPELWGIVTGKVSGTVVVDADTEEIRQALTSELGSEPHILTPKGGGHWYFQHPGHHVKTTVGVIPNVDCRADGGFACVVGNRPDGKYTILRLPKQDNLLPWDKLPERILVALNGSKAAHPESIPEGQPIPEGQRNHTLTSLAGTMRRRGMPLEAIEAALLEVNLRQCQIPLPDDEVKAIAQSVARYSPNGNMDMYVYIRTQQDETKAKHNKNATENATPKANITAKTQQEPLSKRIEVWVTSTAGWFDTPELDRDLGINSVTDKNNRREIMLRLEAKGIAERHPKISKQFRYVNTKVTSLAFKTASNAGVLPVKWPLGIEKYVNLFPGNMAVAAGSPNAGKTALLLRFIYLNQDKFPIFYFCSEMGAVELRDRLNKFPGMDIDDWKFEAIERASDFADVIRPDCINIIDYLEMTTDLYAVNAYLTAISHKLGTGLALVAIQKKQGAAFGRGQEFGMEKPKLYLSMDRGKLQIIKGKSWATKNVDPHGLKVNFRIIGGCEFEATSDWSWE